MCFVRSFRPAPWLVLVGLCFSLHPAVRAADIASPAPSAPFDFANPKLLTGTLYETGSSSEKVLYRFQRTAVQDGHTVRVERKFTSPDGSVAAVEQVVYESGQLAWYEMKEFQAGVSGTIAIAPDPKNPARQKLFIGYTNGLTPPKGGAQTLPDNLVIDDTLYPFMLAHWDELMKGHAVKFHFVSLEMKKAYGFRLEKAGQTTMHGHTHIQIKMEPTNPFVTRVVNPLIFTVEKEGDHRIVSYTGRTTPRVKKGEAWKYLDAETVFDW